MSKKSNLKTYWLTKDDKIIRIPNMDTSHIVNSLSKCLRDNWRIAYIPTFLKELENRGLTNEYPEFFI